MAVRKARCQKKRCQKQLQRTLQSQTQSKLDCKQTIGWLLYQTESQLPLLSLVVLNYKDNRDWLDGAAVWNSRDDSLATLWLDVKIIYCARLQHSLSLMLVDHEAAPVERRSFRIDVIFAISESNKVQVWFWLGGNHKTSLLYRFCNLLFQSLAFDIVRNQNSRQASKTCVQYAHKSNPGTGSKRLTYPKWFFLSDNGVRMLLGFPQLKLLSLSLAKCRLANGSL